MVRSAAVYPLLLVASVFSGCLLDGPSDLTLHGPQWASGYAWAYTYSGAIHAVGTMDGQSRTTTDRIPQEGYITEVINTRHRSAGEPLYLLAVQSKSGPSPAIGQAHPDELEAASWLPPAQTTSLTAVRQRDLGMVPVFYDVFGDCDEEACSWEVTGFEFGPGSPHTYLDFPLKEGKTWSGRLEHAKTLESDEVLALEADLAWTLDARVAGPTTVHLPGRIGDVEAMRVDFTARPEGVEAWLDDLRTEATAEGVSVETLEYSATFQQREYYSDAYQAVVRSESTTSVRMRVAADDGGERHAFSLSVTGTYTQDLDGARLVPKPERGLDYATRLLGGEAPLEDPTGAAHRPAEYALDLVADKLLVNAAENETVGFHTSLVGLDALPPAHSARWRIVDLYGGALSEGEGLDFDYTFNEPGLYGVQVVAVDGRGDIAAAAGTTLVANWETKQALDCTAVAMAYVIGNCPRVELPMQLGLSTLAIEARPVSLAAPLNAGDLLLVNPRGETVAQGAEAPDGSQVILLSDFSGLDVETPGWAAEWFPRRSVLEDVEVSVLLDYTPPLPAASEPSTAPTPPTAGTAAGFEGLVARLARPVGTIGEPARVRQGLAPGLDVPSWVTVAFR